MSDGAAKAVVAGTQGSTAPVTDAGRLTALVTGAYGFVGRHVARALARRGTHVTAIGHGSWDRDEWRRWGVGEWHAADVSIESLVTYAGEPDLVFQCAGSGSVAFSMTHPAQDFERTVGSTLAVLEYLRTQRPQARLIVPSSAGVYGVAETLPITVGSPKRPASPYGAHKLIAEDLCRSYGRHFGVRCAIVRLFSVFGIGIRKQLLWDACTKLAAGDATFAGTGAETRDWLHVEDAAALMLAAAEHCSVDGALANGGTGRAVTIREVVDAVGRRLGKGTRAAFSGRVRPGDPLHYQADIAEALAWGWRPQRDLSADIDRYVDWFEEGAP